MLVLPKRLAYKAFDPVADDGIAAGFADRDAQPGIFKIILGDIERQHAIASTPAVSHYGSELTVAGEPLVF